MRMSASMSVSSNRMRTDLNPRLRCLRQWRIRRAAGEDEREGGDMLSVLMILLAAALPQRGALRHIIRTAPLRPPAPGAARARPTHGPHQGRTGPRFLKD